MFEKVLDAIDAVGVLAMYGSYRAASFAIGTIYIAAKKLRLL